MREAQFQDSIQYPVVRSMHNHLQSDVQFETATDLRVSPETLFKKNQTRGNEAEGSLRKSCHLVPSRSQFPKFQLTGEIPRDTSCDTVIGTRS